MCFQHKQREIKKNLPSVIEEQVYVVQLNVVVIEPPFQSDVSFRNLILKINDIILCIAFSILIFFYINRVLLDTVFICEKCWSKITYNFWKKFTKERKESLMLTE